MRLKQVVISQCTRPDAPLDVTLPLFARWGFEKVEAFTSWAASRLDPKADPHQYKVQAAEWGLRFHTLHLPAVPDGGEGAADEALQAINFARQLGLAGVYVRAASVEAYARHGRHLIEACAEAGLIPLLEPHDGTPARDTASTQRILEVVSDDRLGVVLELGHLARAGDSPMAFYEAMGGPVTRGGRIASAHLKNTRPDGKWAPWREGTIDVPAVVDRLEADGFEGDLVIEIELGSPERTHPDLEDLWRYLQQRLAA